MSLSGRLFLRSSFRSAKGIGPVVCMHRLGDSNGRSPFDDDEEDDDSFEVVPETDSPKKSSSCLEDSYTDLLRRSRGGGE